MSKYLVVIIIGLIIYSIINYQMLKKIIIKKVDIIIINILELSSIFLGSKILDIIVYYNEYLYYNLKQIIIIGFMIYGGLILRIFIIYLYTILRELNKKTLFNILIPNSLLLYSILKVGCFINGCCSGKYNIPLPLLESIIYIIIYLIIKKMKNKISISCIIFGILRIISFYLREDIDNLGFIVNTIISIIIVITGIIIYIYKKKKC